MQNMFSVVNTDDVGVSPAGDGELAVGRGGRAIRHIEARPGCLSRVSHAPEKDERRSWLRIASCLLSSGSRPMWSRRRVYQLWLRSTCS